MKPVFIIILSIILSSCGLFTRTKIEYVKPELPVMEVYPYSSYSFGVLRNAGDTVCIEMWDACVHKEEFLELIKSMKTNKGQLNKANSQSTKFNTLIDNIKTEN